MLDFGFYNMDCVDGMKEFPDNYFDLAIVDPPYGINAPKMSMGTNLKTHRTESTADRLRKGRLNTGSGKLKNRILNNSDCSWDSKRPDPDYFKELIRVSKNQVIFGFNYFSDMLPCTRGVIAWDKMQPWDNFSQVELAYTSFDKPAAIVRISTTGGANTETKIHPTQKPVSLYEWIINRYAKPDDIILDTHVGSASSLIACHNTGHKYVGFEIDETYYKLAKERLDRETAQTTIFDFIKE